MTRKELIRNERVRKITLTLIVVLSISLFLSNSWRKQRIMYRVIVDYQQIVEGSTDRDSLMRDIERCIGNPYEDWYYEVPLIPHFWN